VAINGRVNVDLKNANGGTLVDGATLTPPQAGVGAFTWALTAADAAVVTTTATPGDTERHRITLRVAYTRSGGGEGQITHSAEYDVVKLGRI